MRLNSKFPEDLVTFTEESLNGKLHFLCSINVNLLLETSMAIPANLTILFKGCAFRFATDNS